MVDPTPIRKLTETEAASFIHDSYLMQIREHSCSHCHSGERFSELFEVWANPTRTARTREHILRPATTLRPGFALAYVTLPPVAVPVCSDCVDKLSLDTVKPIPALTHAAWSDTLARKYAPEAKQPAGKFVPPLDVL